MKPHESSDSRRQFLKKSLMVPVTFGAAPGLAFAQAAAPAEEAAAAPAGGLPPVPTRKLGRSGVQVSMINLGGAMGAHSPQYLNLAWSMGIRYFDTADCYMGGRSEQHIAEWLEKYPERRKDVFIVTKAHPHEGPKQLLTQIDERLKACGTDYIDLFFIHWINPEEYGQASLEWPRSQELKEVAEQLKKSGKIKLFGFSAHHKEKAQYMEAAAAGGFIDAIMVAYSPFLPPSDELSRALDACHKAGIGLISMKEMRALGELPKRVPAFDKLGMTSHQVLLHACWSDERIASVCSAMENAQQMKENTEAARSYQKPLDIATRERLRDLALASRPSMCPNCDGRCERAAGKALALNDIARYVTYYERDGNIEARQWYQALAAELRDARGADLAAAHHACLCHLDFASILRKAEEYFA